MSARITPSFLALLGVLHAEIDSDCGSEAVGGMIHHASLGSSFATATDFSAVDKNKSGLQAQNLH